ncbi:hypothetical protein NDU88_005037 [Pleurodeles waltl]|uniref:Uncharacterized protein n=1 Tax=Pleurodeles waltl TaxID=8319 RepID=A0AAV7LR27_PLEWA|nr:hypothetical protein NDU88_005037 [Pleurodeles waltl]
MWPAPPNTHFLQPSRLGPTQPVRHHKQATGRAPHSDPQHQAQSPPQQAASQGSKRIDIVPGDPPHRNSNSPLSASSLRIWVLLLCGTRWLLSVGLHA